MVLPEEMRPFCPRLVFNDVFKHFFFNLLSCKALSVNRSIIHIAVRIMEPRLVLEIQLQQCLRVIHRYVHRGRFQHADVVPQRGNRAAVRARDTNPVFWDGGMLQHKVFGEKVGTAARMVESVLVVITDNRGLVGAQIVFFVNFI